ncbi:XdhC family protein [Micromonospora sp. NPDC050200]|uniref:XdhC family protein n=1 Tax=Micromonospora sp. NPDC050200 TaxID=3155664 RepID=UPI0033F9F0D8
MRTVPDDLLTWWRGGPPVVATTVVATWRSSPRPAETTRLVGPDGTVVRGVPDVCAEAAVHDLGQEALSTGRPLVARYGLSDDAFVGLSADPTGCGAP